MIEALKPQREKLIKTAQCCVTVDPPTHNNMWRRERYKRIRPDFDSDCCQRMSEFTINGKTYCRSHASGVALQKWLNGELVEK